MQKKVDLPKIESYSIALSEKLCNDFYQGNTAVISGAEILKFTPIDQINMFIVKNLFDRWKEESYKLRSPYFDYEQDEVKDALTLFMNKLSRHISIRKEFFKPLLKKSIADTLAYVLAPYEYLRAELLGKPIITTAEIAEREKYMKVNKFLTQGLIKKLQLQSKTGFAEHEVAAYLEEVYKNFESSVEPPDRYIESFSVLLKISVSDLLLQESVLQEPLVVETEEIKKTASVFTAPSEKERAVPQQEQPVKITATINDFFARSKQLSLNDVMMKEEDSASLLAKHRKSKIHDLKSAVPINLRYLFINELFKSSADDYHLAIGQVERCEDLDAAKNILQQVYARKYEWNFEKTEVKEFFELVERRFY